MFKKISASYRTMLRHLSYINRLRQLILWAKREYKTTAFSILVSVEGFETTLPLSRHQEPVPRLIFSTPQHNVLHTYPSQQWVCIYRSYEIEVWEHTGVLSISPIRHGLSLEEKQLAIETAREAAFCFLDKKCSKPAFAPESELTTKRFNEVATVGVAIWVNGELRSSVIEANKPLEKALRRAGRRLCTDTRSKPLTKEEIRDGRLEITIFNSLAFEVSQTELKNDVIHSTNGYKAVAHGKTGWYIPEAFNVPTAPSQSLKVFLQQLVSRKLLLDPTQLTHVHFYNFLVTIFIETTDTVPMDMEGPVPVPTTVPHDPAEIGHGLAKQLLTLQEPDGNILPTCNPTTGQGEPVNWITLSCSAWSLAAFGNITKTSSYTEAAQKAIYYIEQHIYDRDLSLHTKVSTLTYLVRAKKILEQDYTHPLTVLAAEISKKLTYEPILFANIASVLASEHTFHTTFLETAREHAQLAYADFKNKVQTDTSFSLARYPELIQSFLHIYEATQDQTYQARASELTSWYTTQQLSSGAFPADYNHPTPPYTRGTGKIFEILSLDSNNTTEAQRALSWLARLQYKEESLYFVQPVLKDRVQGGLRSSVLNPELRIDASAHTLLGITHLLQQGA